MTELPPVLWLGGGSGAGKTTIARTLAHRFDLGFYRVDAHGYDHRDRLVASGVLPPPQGDQDDRWLAPEPERLAAEFEKVSHAIFPLILDDLRALPARNGVIVEGPQLFPALVEPHLSAPGRALWLLPSEAFQRRSLEARPGDSAKFTSDPQRALDKRLARNSLLDAHTREQAVARGLMVIEVDGSVDLSGMTERVAAHFAAAIAAVPGFPSGLDRSRARRLENDTMMRNVRSFLAELGPSAPPETPLPFACECERLGCETMVHITPTEYDKARTNEQRIEA